jgi:DNA-binding MarR family transcriptional regulator
MAATCGGHPSPRSGPGVAFLLAQIGARAGSVFARRVGEIGLSPAQAGLLRLLAEAPGRSQRELAENVGMSASRFVSFADELEAAGLIERRKNPHDRRLYALYLTGEGEVALSRLRAVGETHERQICAPLSDEQQHRLLELLALIADGQGLTPGVHPDYRDLSGSLHPGSAQCPDERNQTDVDHGDQAETR